MPEGENFDRRDVLGSALKFGRIAEGIADVYLRKGPTMEWDTCAGQAIVEAAGGHVLTLDRLPLRYGKSEFRNMGFVATGRTG
jgi:3'(2'), 5'-bisphosphate nucleotidase